MDSYTWNYETGSTVTFPSYDADILLNKRDGISPGDFIRPDRGLTRLENRRYILEELKQWLCGTRLHTQVLGLLRDDVSVESIREDVSAGKFPAGRLYTILKVLDPSSAGVWGTREVAQLCFSICSANLESRMHKVNEDIQDMALGFVDVDQLSGGGVIRSLWDSSTFDPLREAPPLSETEVEAEVETEVDAEVETDVETEVEAEVETEVKKHEDRPSVDSQIDLALANYYSLLLTPVTISTNIGGISAFFALFAAYVWIVLLGKGM